MVDSYINNLSRRYLLGNSTEHTFRGDLQQLIETLAPGIQATNEPRRQSCGAPDFILTKKDIPIGYIEAKDLGNADLDGTRKTGNKEQFDRYKTSLENLIFTDYLNFHLYRESRLVTKVSIGEIGAKGLKPIPENFPLFEGLIKDFTLHVGQTIKSPKKLAVMMAGKAKLLSEIIERAVTSDESNRQDSTLKDQMRAFKKVLIHEITPKEFADVYAQTLAYGMFAARFVDPSITSFSRQEAAELIPRSNPFLRKLFGYIAGPEIDDRIKWIVDSLAEIFLACDVQKILKNFGKPTQTEDPVVHFYETFLSEYDPKLRKARGVWYTPRPVVDFIVRAVDDILKSEFNLPQGLADTSKVKIPMNPQNPINPSNGNKVTEREVHRVQILDPATGTGTFLAEVVKNIHKKFEGQQGMWSRYVENHLLPRLNGFELLMASYAMAHLKMGMLLTETGYKPIDNPRLKIFLTNTLEEPNHDTSTLFSSWLSEEAREANKIKRDTPVMCILGNPPYSISSSNKGAWIESLTSDYKKNLNERNIQPLSDDYIKFMRLAQYHIDQNGAGIIAYISNNSFLDGRIHRQMRKHLSNSFDRIYIIDLHGSTKKNEKAPDGSSDFNVFDIQQGVSINIFIKSGNCNIPELKHTEIFGPREFKYKWLFQNSLNSINWQTLHLQSPHYFFIPKNFKNKKEYSEGFKISELFKVQACGMVTARDHLLVHFNHKEIFKLMNDFNLLDEKDFRKLYGLGKDSRDWTFKNAKSEMKNAVMREVDYRPFDVRILPYSPNSKGVLSYPRNEIMREMITGNNLGLQICKQQSTFDFQHILVTKRITDKCFLSSQTKEAGYHFPLYLYSEKNTDISIKIENPTRIPNLNYKVISLFGKSIDSTFTNEKENIPGSFAPVDLLDYVYAVLHSPTYREKYKEFLKIDFPRVPYPPNAEIFWQLVTLGGELREIHLLNSPVVENFITGYPMDGDNIINRKITSGSPGYESVNETLGRVWINEQQYFDKVPLVAWEFYIGGYQPAQKWLKDRKDRELSFEDILHYQKIIVALTETSRIMEAIDKIPFLENGEKLSNSNSGEDLKPQKINYKSAQQITVIDPYWERSLKKSARKWKDPAGN